MADRKYSDDSVLTTLSDADKINVLDVSDPTDGAGGTSKQVTYGSLKTLIAALHPNVTLAGSYDYLTISGQVITLNAIDLAADVTGALPIANGGTGQTTAQAALEALAAQGGEIGAGISVIGSANEVQAAIRANASQTANVFVVEDSSGTDKVYVDSDFRLTVFSTHDGTNLLLNSNFSSTNTYSELGFRSSTAIGAPLASIRATRTNIPSGADTEFSFLHQKSGVFSESMKIGTDGKTTVKTLNISNIPTSASGLSSGDVWNDSGTLKIV